MNVLKIALITLIVGIMCQSSHASSPHAYDDFIGTFATLKNAKESNLIKIERQNADYMAREWSESKKGWSELFKIENAEEILSGSPEFKGVIGFQAGMALLVKVPVGWKYGRFTAKTGFALISDYAGKDGVDLYKNNATKQSDQVTPPSGVH